MSGFHHVEVWVADLAEARAEWGWLLSQLGFDRASVWPRGESWAAGGACLTATASPSPTASTADRRLPGVSHVAFRGGASDRVDAIMFAAPEHGWLPRYQDRYPHAGGAAHDAGWLGNSAGFKTEIVADRP